MTSTALVRSGMPVRSRRGKLGRRRGLVTEARAACEDGRAARRSVNTGSLRAKDESPDQRRGSGDRGRPRGGKDAEDGVVAGLAFSLHRGVSI